MIRVTRRSSPPDVSPSPSGSPSPGAPAAPGAGSRAAAGVIADDLSRRGMVGHAAIVPLPIFSRLSRVSGRQRAPGRRPVVAYHHPYRNGGGSPRTPADEMTIETGNSSVKRTVTPGPGPS